MLIQNAPPSEISPAASAPRHAPSQNGPSATPLIQVLEATMRNVPKLKEQNYQQWKNAVTNSIKKAKLWGHIDGSIEQPPDENTGDLIKCFDEAGAVRNAIIGSLETRAQCYIEEISDPQGAWLALEKKYLALENDTNLFSIEQQLADLKLEEAGDVLEHIANFCRLRRCLNKTRLELDEQASIDMLYRSLPPSYRQLILTPGRAEMRDFSVFCARLRDLNRVPGTQAPAPSSSSPLVENYTQSRVVQTGASPTDRPLFMTNEVTEPLGGPYYFIKVRKTEKAAVLWRLFPFLSVEKVVLFCRDIGQASMHDEANVLFSC
ncbi:unnamed protein product [Rhizoctonia solani]|uniref:Retrotransposon Copia-like N-terminal domain-containing protein n=1 Tax=Rhizoctonia solani TaxID=456999 RepID=A0A8H3DGI0_9AGAM|nr:unnamed protein product [Rhizoctonia solani]